MRGLFLSAFVVTLAACGNDKADAFRGGIPQAKDVEMKAPGTGSALTGEGTRRDGLEGQTSDFYRFTRGVTVLVNGGTGAVLNLVHRITQYPATSVTNDSARWGPHTEPLSPNTWMLTVTRTAANTWDYVLQGRGKSEPDSAFRVVLSGTHVALGPTTGSGSFLIDFDQAHALPENDGNVGTVAVTYARPSLSDPTHIDADFTNVKDGAQLVNARYRYAATPGQGGTLDFELDKDFVAGGALEHGKVRSRWLETGAGRSDVEGSGGDLQSAVTISECWDADFLSRYQHASYAAALDYGTEARCAFTSAQYATFAP
ncbi:MAG: hypothetical protein ACOZQL_12165 [Myxococcota bacterium]